jgi:hypothetical protein
MFITITNVSKGKPFTLQEPIDNTDGKMKIGIRSISMWVGWYNIYKEQTCRWGLKAAGASHKINIKPGLYNFNQLAEVLTSEVENLTLSVNPINGLIDMAVPPGIQLFLTEAVRYLLGIDDSDWLEGEYEGDREVEFIPKQIHINLRQLSASNNLLNNDQNFESSQVLGFIPMSLKSKNLLGGYIEKTISNPIFKRLTSGSIHELDFDFKVEWGNEKMYKLDNHSQPIKLVLEIK